MPHLRAAAPALVATAALTLGAVVLGGGGTATAGAPADAARASEVVGSVGGLLAGSYRADFARLSVSEKAEIANKVSPAISGKARVGDVVSVSSGAWKPAKVALDYQWYAGSTKVKGADDASYAPTADVVGEVLTVRVTASKAQYRSTTVNESAGTVARGKIRSTSDPVIRGKAKPKQKLRVAGARWSTDDVSVNYTWLNGRKQVGNRRTYVVRPSDRGDKLRVEVTASRDGFRNGSATSAPTKVARR